MRLTDISVRNLPLPEKGQRTYFDDSLTGFGCRVSQGGTKTFVVQHGADRRLTTIGRYPIITLSDARGEDKRLLAEWTLGKRRPRTITWDAARDLYMAECEQKNRPSTTSSYRRLLYKHFDFKRQRLDEITYEEIERRLNRLNHVPAERNHALTGVKAFLNWAKRPPRRYIPNNPLEGLLPTKRPSRKRKLAPHELVAVYRTALQAGNTFAHIVAFLVLTGQRRGEISHLHRTWFDPVQKTITLPETITKNKESHTFGYGPAIEAVLATIPDQGDVLFPSSREHVRGKPSLYFNGWTKAKKAFDEQCGVTNWTLHDLRRTFGTALAELAVPPHIIERLLNHRLGVISNKAEGTVSAIAEVYIRYSYLPEMRKAIALWEAHLDKLMQYTRVPDAA